MNAQISVLLPATLLALLAGCSPAGAPADPEPVADATLDTARHEVAEPDDLPRHADTVDPADAADPRDALSPADTEEPQDAATATDADEQADDAGPTDTADLADPTDGTDTADLADPTDATDMADRTDPADGTVIGEAMDASGLITFDVHRPASARTEPWRPQVHYTPETGWINDPVGLVFAGGEYHLFQQANPDIPFWGDLQWGHAVGTDLLRWTPLAPALTSDEGLGMPYSGSGLLVEGDAPPACAASGTANDQCLALVFTHHGGPDGTEKQSLAVSLDAGRTWALHPRSPILREAGLRDFRDPKVLRVADGWVMVVAAGDHARFYRSPDLLEWMPAGTFGPVEGLEGTWECPDLFELPVDGTPARTAWVLKIDTNRGLAAARPEAWVFTGHFDGTVFVDGGHGPHLVDWGPDFYAAQSWSNAPDGRRTWIAWMDHWSYALITPTQGWRGALTVPRNLRLATREGLLVPVQSPVDLSPVHLGVLARADRYAVEGIDDLRDAVRGTPLDVTLRLAPGTWSRAGLRLFAGSGTDGGGGRSAALVGYDRDRNEVFVDRNDAVGPGVESLFAGRFSAPRPPDPDGGITLRVIVDRSSVEVFSGDVTLTALVFAEPTADGVGLFSEGGPATFQTLEIQALGTIWPANGPQAGGDTVQAAPGAPTDEWGRPGVGSRGITP